MDSFIHADIFFFVTTVAVVIFTILLCVALYYFIQILVNIRAISGILRGGAENAEESIKNISENLSNNPFIKMFFGRKNKNKKSKK
ncbi:MAG: hypothetical protein M3P22_00180 [bacterium]|nr:hypothetical protein [bacterium]